MPTTTDATDDGSATTTGAMLTGLGWEFVESQFGFCLPFHK
ncbi:MAG: hypothetical protein ABSG95_04510 [Solirubrobacteraceae bacterium]|jgi:hypothetical protein